MLTPVLVFGAVSCKKKDDGGQAAAPGGSVEAPKPQDPVTPDPTPVAGTLSAEKRAELVGFAAHLPQDAEYLISIHDGKDATRRLMATKIWKTFAGLSGMPLGADLDVEDGEEVAEDAADALGMSGPAMLFGEEFTIAMGKGTSEQLQNLLQINARLSHFQMSNLVKMMAAEISSKEGDESPRFREEQFLLDLLNDEKSGVGLFEKTNMPPMYVAFKATDENREMINQQVSGSLQFFTFFGEMVKPATTKIGESTFSGYQLVGANIAEELKGEKEEMEEVMPAATADRLIKAIAAKNLYVVSGIHGDYVVLFIGSSLDDLVFAKDAGSSLAGGTALTFCDAYADKDLLAICYGQGKGLKAVMDRAKGGFADMSAGIRDGLASCDEFGDTRNIDALLRMVEDREAALQALSSINGGGTVAFFEEGLKIESFGGYDAGYNNWGADNQLAVLGTDPNVMLFANVTSNVEYDAKLRDYVEALFETAYAGAMKVAELPVEDTGFDEFKSYMNLFDTKFRVDLLAFWDGFSNGFDGSLGQERAVVIDLEGGMPAFPGIPQEMVDSAKFPRATWIAPVKDRSKLAGAWDKMNGSLTNIAATVSEMVGKEFPMQKPLSSDKDNSKTWFFPLPFFNDDFLPSVTVNDKWFAASTSKLQATDLIAKAEAGGATTQGFVMKANFAKLQQYAKETAGLLGKNGKDLGINEADMEMVNKVIDAFAELDSMNIHVRRDAGQLRSSFHFKMVGK